MNNTQRTIIIACTAAFAVLILTGIQLSRVLAQWRNNDTPTVILMVGGNQGQYLYSDGEKRMATPGLLSIEPGTQILTTATTSLKLINGVRIFAIDDTTLTMSDSTKTPVYISSKNHVDNYIYVQSGAVIINNPDNTETVLMLDNNKPIELASSTIAGVEYNGHGTVNIDCFEGTCTYDTQLLVGGEHITITGDYSSSINSTQRIHDDRINQWKSLLGVHILLDTGIDTPYHIKPNATATPLPPDFAPHQDYQMTF